MRNLLVTGGAGFIGSNFVHYMLKKYDAYRIVVYDKLTYAGRLENLAGLEENPRFAFVRGDICDMAAVRAAIGAHNIDTIVNFAAFTHVDRSIMEPELAVTNNINGTWTLLEAARELKLERFHQISSVTGDTPLLIRDETTGEIALRPIESLDGLDLPNYSVLSLDQNNQVRFARMRHFIKHPIDEIYKITFNGGGTIRATSEHSVFVFDGASIVAKPSAQLRPGDLLVTFLGKVAEEECKPHRFNFRELLQDYITEWMPGSVESRQAILALAQEPARARELFAAASSKVTGYRAANELIAEGFLEKKDGFYHITEQGVVDAALGLVSTRWNMVKRQLHLPYDELVVTPTLMQVFGLYLAEGHAANTQTELQQRARNITFTIGLDETDELELLRRCATEAFGIQACVKQRDSTYQVTYNSLWVHRLFSEFGATAETKRLPSWIWAQPRESIMAFFRGYEGDARIRPDGARTYTSINRSLIEQLVWLGRLNNINTRMSPRTVQQVAGSIPPHCTVTRQRTFYDLVISSEHHRADEAGSWRTPMARCLPAQPIQSALQRGELAQSLRGKKLVGKDRLRKELSRRNDLPASLWQLACSTVGVAVVRSVEHIPGHFMVYDVSVPGIERFFGGNVPCLLHNTDEVYGAIPAPQRSKEGDGLEPRSPYSASKASAEHLVYAYAITYGMYTTTTRGSNNIGPYHYPEKAVPLFTTNAIDNQPLPIYGDGLQMRDYQYVEDHCEGIDVVLHKGALGEIYNVGTGVETHNIDMARKLLDLLGKPHSLLQFVPDRAGHDRRYALDTSKLQALGWRSRHSFDQALELTVRWFVEHEDWWRPIKSGEYLEYYRKQYVERA
jgi:dTDP-D-glucose 4,6-dehydratase/intein/homing endonuclease